MNNSEKDLSSFGQPLIRQQDAPVCERLLSREAHPAYVLSNSSTNWGFAAAIQPQFRWSMPESHLITSSAAQWLRSLQQASKVRWLRSTQPDLLSQHPAWASRAPLLNS